MLFHDTIMSGDPEVGRDTILDERLAHVDSEPHLLLPCDWVVLVVLVPIEALVWVDHEIVSGDADLAGPAALS